MVISDQAGLVAALRRVFQGSAHQRCRVHNIGNVLAHVPKAETKMVAAIFRTIFAQPDLASMAKQWDKVRDDLANRYPKTGPLMDAAKAEVLAFAAFPREHWRKIGHRAHPPTDRAADQTIPIPRLHVVDGHRVDPDTGEVP